MCCALTQRLIIVEEVFKYFFVDLKISFQVPHLLHGLLDLLSVVLDLGLQRLQGFTRRLRGCRTPIHLGLDHVHIGLGCEGVGIVQEAGVAAHV